MSDKKLAKFPFEIALDNIRSALNVGAIFRTCDAANVRKLHLCGITPYPPHNRIPKTALGAEEYMPWERHPNTLEFLKSAKENGATIVCVEQTAKTVRFDTVTYPENTILVFGHEITGVGAEVLELADIHVELPMYGTKESLNVATTAGIMSYHLALQFESSERA